MIDPILVTIVTPSFNQGAFLDRTMRSILLQDYPHVEYIVLDGGSTDGSVEIIRSHEDRLAWWDSGPDGGQAAAIDRGWRRARGSVVAWLNSDDVYEAHAISAVVAAFRTMPEAAVITADCTVIDSEDRLVRRLPSGALDPARLLAGNSFPQPSTFCRRSAVEAVGGIDPGLHYVMDWDLWLRLWLNKARFAHLPRTVAGFRIWGASKTATGGLAFASERLAVLRRYAAPLSASIVGTQSRLLGEALVGTALEVALLYFIANRSQEATALLVEFAGHPRLSVARLPLVETMAWQVAQCEHEPRTAVNLFLTALAEERRQLGLASEVHRWRRQLLAEAHLIGAWEATFAGDPDAARRRFSAALAVEPSWIGCRRVVVPWLKAQLRLPPWRRPNVTSSA